jgi:hypothetical protein
MQEEEHILAGAVAARAVVRKTHMVGGVVGDVQEGTVVEGEPG